MRADLQIIIFVLLIKYNDETMVALTDLAIAKLLTGC